MDGCKVGRPRTGRGAGAGTRLPGDGAEERKPLEGRAPPGILTSDFLLPSDGETMLERPSRARRGASPSRPRGGNGS